MNVAAGRAARVLIVSPEPALQRRVQMLLDAHDCLVVAAASLDEGRRARRKEGFDAVIVDATDEHGAEAAAALCAQNGAIGAGPEAGAEAVPVPVLAVTASRGIEDLARLLGLGVADVVPDDGLEALLAHRLRLVLRASRLPQEPPPGNRRAGRRISDVLVGRSPLMIALGQQIDMIAKADLGVAIYGETGTGKELVARTIHAQSVRARQPFVVAGCTALPETLFENELFGHERGAYTSADRRQLGLLSEAEGGTLLLDEVGDISPGVQAKLLRLLQFREYKLIGGSKTLRADVRILTTTNRDLGQAVAQGRFREDLYYRMNTLQIRLPPLRERRDDIPLLVDHFVRLFNRQEGHAFVGLSADAIERLQQHDWPGNVRELESVVYRSLVMAGSDAAVGADRLQLGRAAGPAAIDLTRPYAELRAELLDRFERSYLEALLREAGGNLSRAARAAHHERKSLWRLLHKHGIDPGAYRGDGNPA